MLLDLCFRTMSRFAGVLHLTDMKARGIDKWPPGERSAGALRGSGALLTISAPDDHEYRTYNPVLTNRFSMMARAMVQQPPRGALIAVEGIQNSGKTTLSKELVSRIAKTGTAVTLMQFPDGDCPTGNLMNNLREQHSSVPPESLLMLSSANKWEREGCIKRLVNEGTTVVLDGFA